MKEVSFQNSVVILREYDYENDPKKLVMYLYNQMGSFEENLQSVIEGDEWLKDRYESRKRFVAEISGELFASVIVERGLSTFVQHRYRLYSVVTAPHYRGTGLSQILFEYTKEWIRKHGGKLTLVETWEDNVSARKFYEKMGFKQYGTLPNGLKEREGEGYINEILYVLEL
jgi:GNAT superfamily N-acetyltransferase